MAHILKRLKGYIAPMLVIYTLLVTYFLAQTAWDDVSKRLRKGTEVRFLDVLVQEERRHLRSFQNVVKNYRGVMQIEMQDKASPNLQRSKSQNDDDLYTNKTKENTLDIDDEGNNFHETGNQENELPHYDNADEANETVLSNELKTRMEQYESVLRNRPKYQVEVEEWDENAMKHRTVDAKQPNSVRTASQLGHQVLGQSASSPNHLASIYRQSKMQNFEKPRDYVNSQGDLIYTTQYCEEIYQNTEQNQMPICKRDLAEKESSRHAPVNSESMLFRQLDGIYIYSAFLDIRDKNFIVRVMTVGRQGLNNHKSVYWCVFPTLLPSGQRHTYKGSPFFANNRTRQASQLVYYAASDGHGKDNQFYIMSCPVPKESRQALLPPRRGIIQIAIGSQERAFLGTVQEILTLKLIVNNPTTVGQTAVYSQQNAFFTKMEEDLQTLNSSSLKSSDIHDNNMNSTKHNDIDNDYNNKKSINDKLNSVIHIVNSTTNTGFHAPSPDPGDKIVVCVAPLQGGEGIIKLVEFIELSFLLGSQHVIFYTPVVTDAVRNILQMYRHRGLVTVMAWNLPAPNSVWAKGRDVALNDCLYRAMHLYDYGLFLDMDEFVVPRITPDLPSFLQYLKTIHKFNATKISDIVFSSAYFPPPTKAQFHNLTLTSGFTRDVGKFTSLKSIHRSYFNPQHTLRMIKLAKARRVGAGERKRTSFIISARFATVNHFSHCPQEAIQVKPSSPGQMVPSHTNLDNAPDDLLSSREMDDTDTAAAPKKNFVDLCSHTKVDWIMWRYKKKLIERTKDSIRRLNGG